MKQLFSSKISAIIISLFCLLLTFSIWKEINASEKEYVYINCESRFFNKKNKFHFFLSQYISALKRMVSRMSFETVDLKKWQMDATNYVEDVMGPDVLIWVHKTQDFTVVKNDVLLSEFDQILKDNQKYFGTVEKNYSILGTKGEKYLVTTLPIIIDNEVNGYICAIIGYAKILGFCIENNIEYFIQVLENGKIVYENENKNTFKSDVNYFFQYQYDNVVWDICITPSQNVLSSWHLAVAEIVVFSGVIISVLFGFLIYLLQKTKQTNIFLKEQKSLFESILNNMAEALVVANPKGEFLLVNPSATRMTGLTKDDNKQPEHWSEEYGCFLPNMVDRFPNEELPLLRALKGENVDHQEMFLKSEKIPDGIFVNINGRCIKNAQGDIQYGLVVFTDITYLKNLKKSNESLDDFAYIVSHDLKEPIRAINNHCNFLLEDYEAILDDDGKKRLHRLIVLTNNIQKLIEDLLHYSRLDREKITMRNVDLNEILKDVVGMFEQEEQTQIKIEDHFPSIYCEPVRIKQVFYNLISNALKYNQSEHKIVQVALAGKEKNIFCIKDNGIGIDPKFHKQVFKMFVRLHSEKKYGWGTGAGLAFIKKIIDQHSGKIWVESNGNDGSTFFFTINSTG